MIKQKPRIPKIYMILLASIAAGIFAAGLVFYLSGGVYELIADKNARTLVKALENKNSEAVRKIFSKGALEEAGEEAFERGTLYLFGFFEGSVVSVERKDDPGAGKVKPGGKRIVTRPSYVVTTTADVYNIYFECHIVDKIAPDHRGLKKLSIRKENDELYGTLRDDFAGIYVPRQIDEKDRDVPHDYSNNFGGFTAPAGYYLDDSLSDDNEFYFCIGSIDLGDVIYDFFSVRFEEGFSGIKDEESFQKAVAKKLNAQIFTQREPFGNYYGGEIVEGPVEGETEYGYTFYEYSIKRDGVLLDKYFYIFKDGQCLCVRYASYMDPGSAARKAQKDAMEMAAEELLNSFVWEGDLAITTDEVVAWAKGCSAILAVRNGYDPYEFGMLAASEINEVQAQLMLIEFWNCKDRDDVIRIIETMTDGGHNAAFAELYGFIASLTEEDFESLIEMSDEESLFYLPMTKMLGDKWGEKQIKAWDWFRMIHVAGWGYVAGYLELKETYGLMKPVIEKLRTTFSSWEEANENYMDGFAWWSGANIMEPNDSSEYREYMIRMGIYEELRSYPPAINVYDPSLWPDYVPDENEVDGAEVDVNVDNFLYEDNGDGTCTITGFQWETGELNIPAEINGLKVTVIGKSAFYKARGFKGPLTIPDSVTTIEERAFEECQGLTGKLILPPGITSIGERAFMYCFGFTGDLTLPGSLKEVGGSAFHDCTGFSGKLIISEGVVIIGDGAFYNCRSLSGSIVLPKSLEEIKGSAFNGCFGFSGTVEIPENLTKINTHSAFQRCPGITAFSVSDRNKAYTSVDGILYSKDKSQLLCAPTGMQKKDYAIPSGAKEISKNAFQQCTGFTGTLKLPQGLTKICNKAFEECSGLDSIIIPDSVTEIENEAFRGCSRIKSITIPAGVTKIDGGLFYDCDSLETVEFLGDAPEKFNPNGFRGTDGKVITIIYDPNRSGWSTPLWNDIPCYPKG